MAVITSAATARDACISSPPSFLWVRPASAPPLACAVLQVCKNVANQVDLGLLQLRWAVAG